MPRLFVTAAFAAAALTVVPTLAFAEDGDFVNSTETAPIVDLPLSPAVNTDTTVDLGIDVSGVAHTPAAAKRFLLGLAPDAQTIIIDTCEHYMATPESYRTEETITFCSNAVGG